MRPKHLIPNGVTLANIGFGFAGIIAASEGKISRAVVLFFFGAMCDLLDGRLARALNATSEFGLQLDSLSDMVSFGIAPAFLVYFACLKELGALGGAIACGYALCGALRLARYNSATTTPMDDFAFNGFPIPIAASYMWSFVLVRDALPLWLIAVATIAVSAGMISTLKVPKFRRGGLPIGMMFFGLGAYVAFLAWPRALTWHVWNTWNGVIVITTYVVLSQKRKTDEAFEAKSA